MRATLINVKLVLGRPRVLGIGLLLQVTTKFGSTHMFTLFTQVWNVLPIAAVIDDKAFVVHGGLFRVNGITLSHVNSIPRRECDLGATSPDMQLLVDVLWNDPQAEKGRSKGLRGGGTINFGPDVTEEFLKRTKLELVIRSHQVWWRLFLDTRLFRKRGGGDSGGVSREAAYSNMIFREPSFRSRNRFWVGGWKNGGSPHLYSKPGGVST